MEKHVKLCDCCGKQEGSSTFRTRELRESTLQLCNDCIKAFDKDEHKLFKKYTKEWRVD